jgi:cell division protein ZapE
MTPWERYQHDLQKTGFMADPAQESAVKHLQIVYDTLIKQPNNRLLKWFYPSPRGLYLWGGVGRGKTYLMDLFYESLPFPQKQRLHFHRFMQRVHHDLQKWLGEKNPLQKIAKQLAQETKVICFDEFFVEDITDAMLLGGLLQALFQKKMVLVATSNIAPRDLYQKGILRERFLPAIALIEQYTTVWHLSGDTDYRFRVLSEAPVYKIGDALTTQPLLQALFTKLAVGTVTANASLEICDRHIPSLLLADNMVWFDFNILCGGARSQYDYIEIAALYSTVMLSHVPILTEAKADAARRFIHLIDVFYDNNIRLILSADAMPQALYQGKRFQFEFNRTQSRLQEMQTEDYLQRGYIEAHSAGCTHDSV